MNVGYKIFLIFGGVSRLLLFPVKHKTKQKRKIGLLL